MEVNKIVETAKKSLGNLVIGSNVKFIYVAGSLVEGFGNESSDVDMFVITEDMPKIETSEERPEVLVNIGSYTIHNILEGGIRYDIEYHTIENFGEIVRKLNTIKYDGETLSNRLTDQEFDFLHRLKDALPIENEELFYSYLKNINFSNLKLYKAILHLEEFGGLLEDANGAFQSGDFGSSFIMLNILLDSAINGFISMHGETNPKNKWIYRKIKRYQNSFQDNDFFEKYCKLKGFKFTEDLKKERFEKYVKEIFSYAQELNIKTQNYVNSKLNEEVMTK
ncbi:nucleotidyltransferase domain-containing protein [Bacillus sp. 1A]|uniref:nucleotidyltransferase domain-containing protein n=1 Tax=Bacillus sp. 1A TaxID=3461399 RepID=UPI004043C51E